MNKTEGPLTILQELPGGAVVSQGLLDLRAGKVSEYSLLVLIAAPRLNALGLDVSGLEVARPYEHQLYALLEREKGAAAYSYYNSLLRLMASFTHCLEREGVLHHDST